VEPYELLAGAILVVVNFESEGKQFSPETKLAFITAICEDFQPPTDEPE
jgi:hypothetical protein